MNNHKESDMVFIPQGVYKWKDEGLSFIINVTPSYGIVLKKIEESKYLIFDGDQKFVINEEDLFPCS